MDKNELQDISLRLRPLVRMLNSSIHKCVNITRKKAYQTSARHGTSLVQAAIERMRQSPDSAVSSVFLENEHLLRALPVLEQYMVMQFGDISAVILAAQLHVLASVILSITNKRSTAVAQAAEAIKQQVVPIASEDALPSAAAVDAYMAALAAMVHCAQAPALLELACSDPNCTHDSCARGIGVLGVRPANFADALRLLVLCMYTLEQINFVEYNEYNDEWVWSKAALLKMLNETYDADLANEEHAMGIATQFSTAMLRAYQNVDECRSTWRVQPPSEDEGGSRKRKRAE